MQILASFLISTFLWLMIIREKDKIEKEPLWVLIKTVLKGGVLSIVLLSIIYIPFYFILPGEFFKSHLAGNGTHLMKFLFAMYIGVVEEFAKAWAAIILTRKLAEFDEPVDGMIYGMAVALGFAAFENIEYMMNFSYKVIYVRSVLSVPAHISFGMIWGYGLALNKFKHKRVSNLVNLFPFIIAAAFLHGIYDYICFTSHGFPYHIFFLVTVTFISYRWGILKTRKLVAVSPFLKPGECSNCRTINDEKATVCTKCEGELPDKDEFYSDDEEKSEN